MAPIIATFLCLVLVQFALSDDDIHKYMSSEEAQSFFHSNSVPKYEIVKVQWGEKLRKRDLSDQGKLHLKAFGKDINLWLHPRDDVLAGQDTPVYYGRYSANTPQKVRYMRMNLMEMVGRIFEDPRTLASFVIGKDSSGGTRVSGYIESERMVVKPLPERIAKEYIRNRRSAGFLNDVEEPFHVVFETNQTNAEIQQWPTMMQIEARTPDVIYPKILVVVEYSMYRAYERDIYGLLEYVLAFWNGVDLKYRSLTSPSVRFHIAGIILGQNRGATPYISENAVSPDAFNSSRAMIDSSKFYYSVKDTFPLHSFDIAATMTRQEFGLDDESRVLGKAWIGKVCEYYDENEIRYGITIFRDDGAFAGVLVGAHELGHLLGARHDVERDGCSWNDGFLMSFVPWYTKNTSDFSSCSIEHIDSTIKAHKLDCLFNRPQTPKKTLPRLMPGRLLNGDEQCKLQGFVRQCLPKDVDTCVQIWCASEDGNCSKTGASTADGTKCGSDGQFCLHQECVELNNHQRG